MKPPTTKEKLYIYESSLAYLKRHENYGGGLCYLLIRFQGYPAEWGSGSAHLGKNSMKHNFPEIHKHKPINKSFGYYWWPLTFEGMTKRISILEEAIQTLKSKYLEEAIQTLKSK